MNRFILCLAGLLALTACSKKLAIFSSKSNQLNLNNLDYDNLSMKSKIKYKDENRDLKASANIRVKKDSIIWFSLTPGLGIEAARGIVTKDSIVILDKIHKEYQVLKVSELSDKYHFDFDLKLLESIIIGNLIWPINNEDDIKKEDGYFKVKKSQDNLTVMNFIGSNSMKLEKIQALSDTSGNAMSIDYAEFLKVNDKVIPSEINIEINYRSKRNKAKKVSKVQIKHSRININKEDLNFTFSIPDKYEPM
ncbi:DUF4292 domain-containing protein [Reichenbachiella carrageenanivorans]|uniref:DUF4292 domain-containing protein n=1 Tax=Reichenbachiella carrageenanivorans TaxID=2979869 RepID=A0ABY6D422_9BACT|nr:DUF4292 domain-containing protein [Reichenbachiella carrageenanivorans]UXX80664.1 DUF4292 domain-containing protein [Reichenbachiella carrageenanivorans]